MKFTPKSEDQIEEENKFKLLEPGEYDFEIATASDEISSNKNEMIKLTVNVFGNDGNSKLIFDYLLESISYKLRHCADACGLLDKYENGELVSSDFIGRTGKCKVVIQKDKTKKYPDKNGIQDYVKRSATSTESPKKSTPADLDDDIPF